MPTSGSKSPSTEPPLALQTTGPPVAAAGPPADDAADRRARRPGRLPSGWVALGRTLGKLALGVAFHITAIAAARFALHPAIEHLFGLEGEASAVVRRAGILVAAVLGYWAFVRWYERRGAEELTLRWRAAALGAMAGASSIGITLLMLYGTGLYRLVAIRGLSAAASGVATAILVAAVLEEILFRGLLFRVVEERFGTWRALTVVSVLFGAVHLANPGSGSLTGLSVTLLGLMWAGVFIWSRNLWVVVAHHAAWNLAIFATGLPLSGSEDWRAAAPFESESRGHELWTGGAFGPEDSIVSILVSSVCIVGILWLARRNGRWLKAAPLQK